MTIRVGATETDPNYDTSLSDGTTTVGFVICNQTGVKKATAITESPIDQMALQITSGDVKYSSRKWPYRSQSQNDWSGGRGGEDFDEDTSKYADGWQVDTLGKGVILGGLPTYTSGHRSMDQSMPGSVYWQGLYDTYAYLAVSFVASASYSAYYLNHWIRKVGSPGALYACIYSNSSGSPGTATVTGVMNSSVTDILSVQMQFNLTTTALTSGTTYWLVLYSASHATDNATNHWEVGCQTTAGKRSTAGSTWTTTTIAPYYRVLDNTGQFVANFFEYKGQLYFATRPDDGTAGKLYMNGFRGVADVNSGDKTYLNDSTQNFNSVPIGAVVEIYDGRGSEEDQPWRSVLSPDTGSLAVFPDWNVAHQASGAEATLYNVIGCNTWQQKTLFSDVYYPFTDAVATGDTVWLARGEDFANPSWLMSHYEYLEPNSGTWNTGGNYNNTKCTYLKAIQYPDVGYVLWLGKNSNVSVHRVLVPRGSVSEVYSGRQYHSISTYGFMSEIAIIDLANDTFNRADAALGTTNGAWSLASFNHTASSGSGVSWSTKVGTISIVSNKAKASAVSSGVAIATCSVGKLDVACASKVDVAGGGVTLRYKDTSNYIRIYHNGTNIVADKVVATVSTNLISTAATFVAGGLVEAQISGTRLRVKYNGTSYGGDVYIADADLQTGTNHGVYFMDTNATIDQFACYPVAAILQRYAWVSAIADLPRAIVQVSPEYTTGLLCADEVDSEDWRTFKTLGIRMKVSKAMAAGELQIVLDNTSTCGSPYQTIDLPALSPDIWYTAESLDVTMELETTDDAETTCGVGLNLTVEAAENFTVEFAIYDMQTEDKDIYVGDQSDKICGLEAYDDPRRLFIMKQGSIWGMNEDVPQPLPLDEISTLRSSQNNKAHCVSDVYLCFNLQNNMMRYFRTELTNIGPANAVAFPSNRRGNPVHAVSYPGGSMYIAWDGGTDNYSSVLCYSGGGWCEIWRAPIIGQRIRRLHIQPIQSSTTHRLWISCGADIVWLPISRDPYNDPDYRFVHEGALTTGYIYYGMQDYTKVFKSFKLFLENVTASEQYVRVDYRKDNDTAWTAISGDFDTNPLEELDLVSGRPTVTGRRIQFRIRLYSTSDTETPRILTNVIEAVGFGPVKYSYQFMTNVSEDELATDKEGEESAEAIYDDLGTLMAQLKTWANTATVLTFRSNVSGYDNKYVYLSPITSTPTGINPEEQLERSFIRIVVYEA